MVQLVGDSLAEAKKQGLAHGWTGIIGNPAKFGLGLVSVSFDVSFCNDADLNISSFDQISSSTNLSTNMVVSLLFSLHIPLDYFHIPALCIVQTTVSTTITQ